MTLTKDQLVAFEEGEYSDYGVIGFFRVLKDFSLKEEIEKYLKQFPEEAEDYCAELSKLVGWLSAEGFIEDVAYQSIWLGAYGTIKKDFP
jgi:hypothetical protein